MGYIPPKRSKGLKPKDLCMVPDDVFRAMRDDGWWLRSIIVWVKEVPMPESVTDRPTSAWEPIGVFTKSRTYYWDADAVRTPLKQSSRDRFPTDEDPAAIKGANMRNVWILGPDPYHGPHYATFPSEIPRRAIKAGCPAGGLVLDPFCGSGTTGAVAVELGRRFIGLDLSYEYLHRDATRRTGLQAWQHWQEGVVAPEMDADPDLPLLWALTEDDL